MPRGTFRGSDQGGACPAFPLPNRPGKSAWLSGQVLHPQRPPPGRAGPGGIRGRPGESKRGRWEGPSRTRRVGESRGHWPHPLELGKPTELPGWVSHPPRPPLHLSWAHRREAEGEQEKQVGRVLQDWRAGEEWRTFASPTQAWEACWAPRWGLSPSENRGGRYARAPSVPLSLSPNPHTSQGLFQPCGS